MINARVKHKRLEISHDSVTGILEFRDGKGFFITNDFETEIGNDGALENFILSPEFEEVFTGIYCTNLDLLDDIRRGIADRRNRTR